MKKNLIKILMILTVGGVSMAAPLKTDNVYAAVEDYMKPEDFSDSVFNSFEKYNVNLLSAIEKGENTEYAESDKNDAEYSADNYEDAQKEDWQLYHQYFAEESYHSDMKLYYQYVQTYALGDYLKGISGNQEKDDSNIKSVRIADFDGDNRVEIWIKGAGASGNTQASILDVVDGQVVCVFSDWGTEYGQYIDPETGKKGLVIAEGNGESDLYFHTWLSFFDQDWNRTVLCDGEADGSEAVYKDRYGNFVSSEENMKLWEEIRSQCTKTPLVFNGEYSNMNKQELLNVLYLAEQGEA